MAQTPGMKPAEFASRQFDFVVVGGGTAGLAVASRLAEHSGLSVGVLEAGPAISPEDDDDIRIPGRFGRSLGGRLDWKFETTPQPGLRGRKLPWPRGKALGGTSMLNFMAWNRGNREDYDAWSELGNSGWSWEELLPFFKKSETFHPPSPEIAEKNTLLYDPETVGSSGPIDICFASEYTASHQLWHSTLHNLGVETNRAPIGGSNVGVFTNLGAVHPNSATRSSSMAYYLPNAARPNLAVLTDALVTKIALEKSDEGEWTATGVHFRHGNEDFSVMTTHEVILCAGSVQSPQILELSGIGDPDILARAGVNVQVPNPNVGENLQDHIMAAMIFEVDPSLPNPDDLKLDSSAAAAAMEQYETSRSGPLTILAHSLSYLPFSHCMPSDVVESLAGQAKELQEFGSQNSTIRQSRLQPSTKLGEIEFIFDLGNWSPFFKPDATNGKKYATCLQILQYPFSKGSIHIQPGAGGSQATAFDKPRIDPRYYEGPHGAIDVEAMAQCARFADKLSKTKPLANIIRSRSFPPPSSDGEDEDFRDWIIDSTITDWHPVGTCAMGGNLGAEAGVVDERLRVYGINGLRVIDASIIPLQISAHLQATVFMIAEKGAQMILEDAGVLA